MNTDHRKRSISKIDFKKLVNQIESFSEVGGKTTSASGTPHKFYLTAHYLI